MSRDGEVYPINEGPRPPFHFNCRTTTVPVTKSWKDLGAKKQKEVPASSRASMDGQVPDRLTYEDWLKLQTKDVQVEALGARRAALFRESKLDVKDLTNEFGRPITIKELEATASISTMVPKVELKNQIVDLLFEAEKTALHSEARRAANERLKRRGWVRKPQLPNQRPLRDEFSPSKNGRIVWKPEAQGKVIAITRDDWTGDLEEYTAAQWKGVNAKQLLQQRVEWQHSNLVVSTIDAQLKELGYTGKLPSDSTSLNAALASFAQPAPTPGTIKYAQWKEKNATSSSVRLYWSNRIKALRAKNALGLADDELAEIRARLLKKYSTAKVDAIIASARTKRDLLDR
jgi:hypothetical protein